MASSRNSASPDPFLVVVASCLRRHLSAEGPPSRLCVGLSGGRDSVALVHALHRLQPEFDYRLSACHVHHGLSPYADRWRLFCSELCAGLDIPLTAINVEVPRGTAEGLEAAARGLRYAVYGGQDADWLLLGQHRGDQAETLLFNLLRGAGLQGAAGIPECREVRPGMRLLRPLRDMPRDAIEAYLLRKGLDWIDDESNDDQRFSRNFLRHRILPELTARFPAAEARLAAAAERFGEAHALLDDLARIDLAGQPSIFPIAAAHLAGLPEPRARNVLRYLMQSHGVRIPAEARLREGLRQMLAAGLDRHPRVEFGEWCLIRQGRAIMLEKSLGKMVDNAIK